jgi:hypothetical protein
MGGGEKRSKSMLEFSFLAGDNMLVDFNSFCIGNFKLKIL